MSFYKPDIKWTITAAGYLTFFNGRQFGSPDLLARFLIIFACQY